jgi:hypothetical protein
MLVVYSLGSYHVTVTTRTHAWHVSFPRFPLAAFARLELSWQAEEGVAVFLNGALVARSIEARARASIGGAAAGKIVVGRSVDFAARFGAATIVVEDVRIFQATIEACESAGLVRLGE